jgi:hypothetical protein
VITRDQTKENTMDGILDFLSGIGGKIMGVLSFIFAYITGDESARSQGFLDGLMNAWNGGDSKKNDEGNTTASGTQASAASASDFAKIAKAGVSPMIGSLNSVASPTSGQESNTAKAGNDDKLTATVTNLIGEMLAKIGATQEDMNKVAQSGAISVVTRVIKNNPGVTDTNTLSEKITDALMSDPKTHDQLLATAKEKVGGFGANFINENSLRNGAMGQPGLTENIAKALSPEIMAQLQASMVANKGITGGSKAETQLQASIPNRNGSGARL